MHLAEAFNQSNFQCIQTIIFFLSVALSKYIILICSLSSLFLHLILDCPSVSARDVTELSLTIPTLDPSLPVPLNQFTWLLRLQDQSTVDLMSPKGGSLHQSLPDKPCNERVSLLISETEGSNIGQFCSAAEGIIQKIQIKGNVSITVTPKNINDLSQEKGPFLKFAISPEITGKYTTGQKFGIIMSLFSGVFLKVFYCVLTKPAFIGLEIQ